MSLTEPSKHAMRVRPIWHCQVHQSRVTALKTSDDGSTLHSGCDATNPGASGEPPVVMLQSADGSTRRVYGLGSPASVRLIRALPGQVVCYTGQAAVLQFDSSSGSLIQNWAFPNVGTPDQASCRGAAASVDAARSLAAVNTEPQPDQSANMVYVPIGHGSYQFDGHASIQVFAACRATNLFFSNAPSPKKSSVLVWTHDAAGLQPPVLQTVLEGHTADVLSLDIAQDGSLLFSGSYDKTIRIWSTRSWTCAKVLQGHAGGVRALVASRDGKLLYSAAADNTIRVWSMVHGVCLRLMQGRHEDMTWPCVMALSPDGSLLATGSTGPFGGSTIKLFCAQTQPVADPGACLATLAHLLHDQKGDISALEFSGNGCVLFSGASDGTVAAWSIERGDAPAVVSCTGLCRGFL